MHLKQIAEMEDFKDKQMEKRVAGLVMKIEEKEDLNKMLQESNRDLNMQLENYEKEVEGVKEKEAMIQRQLEESKRRENDLIERN